MQPDESERTLRNHPSVIVGHLFSAFIILVVIILAVIDTGEDSILQTGVAIAVLMVIVAGWSYFWWKRTFYIFTDTELHVTRDAIYKVDKHIQYTRLASVGVRRDIINRIFGTSTLVFNVNSSINATAAEATLVLKKDVADRLRDQLNALIFNKQIDVAEDLQMDTMIRVSNRDIIVHSILGQPTWQALFGFLMLLYAIAMLFIDNSGGLVTAVVLLVVSEVLPFISSILRYYNYRIFRVGDTITVESGLITTRRNSFRINKINSVRIREPLFGRLFRRAMLEAEVVGMAEEDNSNVPLLCPLKARGDVTALLYRLVPELAFEPRPEHQPRKAVIPMLITDVVFAVIVIVFFGALLYTAETYLADVDGTMSALVRASEVFFAVLIPVLIFGHTGLAQKHRSFDMAKDSFMFVYGGYDLQTEYINIDKVQYVEVVAGPLQRAFGVASCSVHMMSSVGFKEISSGLFLPEDLERVPDEVMSRIRDGRYDYRKYY